MVFAAFAMPAWSVADTRARVRVSLRDSFPVMFGAEWERARDIFYAALAEQHLQPRRADAGCGGGAGRRHAWPQGVVSNKAGRYLRAEVAHLGWAGHFRAVVGAGDAARRQARPGADPARARTARLHGRPLGLVSGRHCTRYAGGAGGWGHGCMVGDASHDGGIDRAHPDIHFQSALDRAAAFVRWAGGAD